MELRKKVMNIFCTSQRERETETMKTGVSPWKLKNCRLRTVNSAICSSIYVYILISYYATFRIKLYFKSFALSLNASYIHAQLHVKQLQIVTFLNYKFFRLLNNLRYNFQLRIRSFISSCLLPYDDAMSRLYKMDFFE